MCVYIYIYIYIYTPIFTRWLRHINYVFDLVAVVQLRVDSLRTDTSRQLEHMMLTMGRGALTCLNLQNDTN